MKRDNFQINNAIESNLSTQNTDKGGSSTNNIEQVLGEIQDVADAIEKNSAKKIVNTMNSTKTDRKFNKTFIKPPKNS